MVGRQPVWSGGYSIRSNCPTGHSKSTSDDYTDQDGEVYDLSGLCVDDADLQPTTPTTAGPTRSPVPTTAAPTSSPVDGPCDITLSGFNFGAMNGEYTL